MALEFMQVPRFVVIGWKEKSPGTMQPGEIFDCLMKCQRCEGLEEFPIEAVVNEILNYFRKKNRSVERLGDYIRWIYGGVIHEVEVRSFYFTYKQSIDSRAGARDGGGGLEICEFPTLSGLLGCSLYFPRSDNIFRRPLGAVVRSPAVLFADKLALAEKTMAVQLPLSSLKPPMQMAVVTIGKTPEELEMANGIVFEEDIDSLSNYRLALIEVGEYSYFLVKRERDDFYLEVYMHENIVSLEEAVNVLMIGLGLVRQDLRWCHRDLKFTEFELWRQDDNGNQALIDVYPCRADALRQVKLYTDRGHKQMYWAKEHVLADA